VSVLPLLAVVFNVLTASFGNLNIAIFLLGSCSLPLFLVATVLVETPEPPTEVVNCNDVLLWIDSTICVLKSPASVTKVISSPIFNSVLNKVPKPVTEELLFPIDKVPVICKLSP